MVGEVFPIIMGMRGTDAGEDWKEVLCLRQSNISIRCVYECERGQDVQRQHLVNVRQVHLETVFVLIYPPAHGLEIPAVLQLLHQRGINGQVAEWSCVGGAGGRRSAGEVVVV